MGRAFEYRKATKLKRWGHMAKTFTKLGKQIAIAVRLAVQNQRITHHCVLSSLTVSVRTCLRITSLVPSRTLVARIPAITRK